MHEIMQESYGNPSSIHALGRKSRALIEKARKSVAKILNASVGEIYFTSSATEANNMIIKRAVVDLGVKTFITSPTEHHCVLHALGSVARENKSDINFLTTDNNGDVSLPELESTILNAKKNGPVMVSIMHGNNEIGNIHPIEEISQLCVNHGVYFHCDAVQTIGKYPIDLQKIKINFLSGTAHKFHGPKGVGFFYMNNENILTPFIDGGAQERNMRAGTENLYGIAALAKALEMYHEDQKNRINHIVEIRDYFESAVSQSIPSVYVNANDARNRMAHISSISFPPSDKADMIMFNLDIHGICASSGSACSAGIEEDSHVLTSIRHPKDRKTVRFSFAFNTTKEEIDYTINILKKIT